MSAPSHEPDQPLTTAQLDAWMHRASLKRRHILLGATDASPRMRAQALLEMGTLCLDALEEVRIISAQMREESQAARFKAQDIVAESARLLAQHTRMTESQLLNVFKGDRRQRENPE